MTTLNPFKNRPIADWRAWCLGSLYFLCTVVLKTAWEDKFHNFGVLQKYLCRFLEIKNDVVSGKKYVSVFRGSYKTTVLLGFVIYLFCWSMVKKKPVSICYNNATRDNADNFMEDFRETIRECRFLHWIFPELPKDSSQYRKWTKSKVEYKWFKFHVSSMDTRQVSRHYTIYINDDLVNDINAFSKVERESTMRKWRFQKSIITKHVKLKVGYELDVGTPYHSKDLMSYIMHRVDTYEKFIVPCALPDDKGVLDFEKGIGTLMFPEVASWEDYRELKKEQGASIFNTQYLLLCMDETDVLCKPEWIQYYKFLPENYRRYMIVDPAGTKDTDDNCPTGIIVADVNESGSIFLLHAMEYWVTPRKLIETMEELRVRYDPDESYIEKEKYSITIADTFDHIAPKLNFSFVEHKNEPKEKRIQRLKQWFETGRIFLNQGLTLFEDRILNYPDCAYDDMLDAFAYLLKVMNPPSHEEFLERKKSKNPDPWDEMKRNIALIEGVNQGENYDHIF